MITVLCVISGDSWPVYFSQTPFPAIIAMVGGFSKLFRLMPCNTDRSVYINVTNRKHRPAASIASAVARHWRGPDITSNQRKTPK